MLEPTREIYWNVEYARYLIYPFFLVLVGILGYGLYNRYRLLRLGQPEGRRDNPRGRLGTAVVAVLSQSGLLREGYPGLAHVLIFWGFILLTIGTTLVLIQEDLTGPLLSFHFLRGDFYLWFSLVLDLAGLAAIIGTLMFMYRRYVARPAGVQNRTEDLVILLLFLAVLLGGFLAEATRIAVDMPPFEVWSPVGWTLALGLRALGLNEEALRAIHAVNWWAHMFLAFAFLGYVGYSKLLHIVTAPLNMYLRSTQPVGALAPIANLEEAETYGVGKVEEFTWKQLLDSDACTRCGRCQDNCPAWNTDKPLSPRKVVLDVGDELQATGPALRAQLRAKEKGAGTAAETPRAAMIGGRIQEDELWSCTTCRACQEHCPVYIEHVPKIVDMRRYLVLSESRFPSELNTFFRSLENNGCPWEVAASSRGDWAAGLGVRPLAEAERAEYVWWVGCAASVDDRNRKVAVALARVLQAAGVDFAILGAEEKCCGDPARRTGNEYLFQMLAAENIEVLKGYGVQKLLVHCPHCYNTLKNEYPQFEGNFQVVHTSELIAGLLQEGRLRPAATGGQTYTFHDPCYLGRYSGLYDPPRQALAVASGAQAIEMKRSREKSFCCGGGGGRMWMEEHLGRRINQTRIEDAVSSGAGAVAVSCPFCLTMLGDGVKEKGLAEQLQVMDYVEVLAASLAPGGADDKPATTGGLPT